ncbi:MAG TPA: DUF309 domain-containing protein [Planctomycetota bacterium]|nr:DUF309 domain-containing protein [Planctomycetota bacterium]
MIPTLPRALRDRLAVAIVEALGDAQARERLGVLAAAPGAWLAPEEVHLADRVAARARRASEALTGWPLVGAERDLRAALAVAAVLFDAGLPFEVHEILEPHWVAAEGDDRQALQGLIQTAVAYQHLANGNVAGARSLLIEAASRLHGRTLLGTDLAPLARLAGAAAATLAAGRAPAPPVFPRPR